jgi:MFS family permease
MGARSHGGSFRVRQPGQRRRSLLRRNRQLRLLLTARVVSFAGDQLTAVALTLHVHDRYGIGTAVSVLLVAQVLPQLAGSWAGAIVDRTDQRRVLRVCEVARGATVLTIVVLLPPLPVLAGLVAVNGGLASILRPAGRSAIPVLVDCDPVFHLMDPADVGAPTVHLTGMCMLSGIDVQTRSSDTRP